jgi:hypothetical protein
MIRNLRLAVFFLITISICYACDTNKMYSFEEAACKKIECKFEPLKAKKRTDFFYGNPSQIIKHNELYYFSIMKREGYLISVVDSNYTDLKDSLIIYGKGANEVLGFSKFGFYDDKMWVFDITQKVVNFYKKKDGELIQSNRNKLNNIYYDLDLISENKVIGSGDFRSRDKLMVEDLNEEVIESKKMSFGEYGSGCESLKTELLKDISTSYVNVNHGIANKVVVAYRYSDLIEIYDLQKQEMINALRGPDLINPRFKVGNRKGSEFMQKVADTRKAFVNMYSDSDNIFLIYSGGKRYTENWIGGKKIIILNWEGEVKGTYLLEENTYCLFYDKEREVLITYSIESGSILEYKIQI